MARIIFDAGADADFDEHFEIVFGAGEEALGFEELALAAEVEDLLVELFADVFDGGLQAILGHDVVDGGIDED